MEYVKNSKGMWVNTSLFSPVLKDAAPPIDSIYYDSWWYDQRNIIMNDGYSVGGQSITGDHYFYLNFWKIRGIDYSTKRKGIISPRFLEMDHEYFHHVDKARLLSKNIGLVKGRQTGFELPDSEPVLTDHGWVPNGDLKVGDKVSTRKGTYTPILEIFPQGVKDVYELELIDGRKVRCGLNHKWAVYKRGYRKYLKIITTKELIDHGLTYPVNNGKNIGYSFKIPDIAPVPFSEKELPIDPYLIGLLAGDGDYTASIRLSTIDYEIIDYLKPILGEDYEFTPEYRDDYVEHRAERFLIKYIGKHTKELKKRYGLRSIINKFNPLKQEMKLLGMFGNVAKTKHIPEIYKNSSVEQRIEVLRGLLDSDGHIADDSQIEFKTISRQLCEDILYISRSLGAKANFSEHESKQGHSNYFRVYIKLTHFNPFRLKRKADNFNPNKKIYRDNSIVSIKKLDYKESSTCIMVEDEDHIYLTRDFIPTHNSEKHACMIGKEFCFYPGSQSVIVSGLDKYTKTTMGFVRRGLNALASTEFYKNRQPNREEYFKAAYHKVEYRGKKRITTEAGYLSEVYAITAKNSVQAVSSLSPSFVLLEEAGVFPGVIEVYKFINPSLYSEDLKTGIVFFVGTGGEMEKGAEELQYIIFNPDEFDLLSFDMSEWEDDLEPGTIKMGWFCPKWKYKVIDEEGNYLKDESIKKINEERDKIKDEAKKYTEITQQPIIPTEAFMIKSGGFFGKANARNLNKIKAEIRKNPDMQLAERGDLNFTYNEINGRKIITGVEFKPNKEGIFEIIERPSEVDGIVPEDLYAAGTDSYDKDEANTSSSKLSTEIFKTFLHNGESYNTFVAGMHYRPDILDGGSPAAYEASAKLCLYYRAKNLIEWSNIRIFDWYERHNFTFLLKERPEMMIANWIKNSSVSNRYGIDPSTKIHWLSLLSEYIKDNWYKFRSDRQIDAFIKFKLDPNYNCDVTMGSALAYLNAYEMASQKRRTDTEPQRKQSSPLPRYKMKNGIIVTS